MTVEFSNRAVADLEEISVYSCREFGDRIAAALAHRIRATIERISEHPQSAANVAQRPGVHVVQLGRFPFKIFYRVLEAKIRIQHIRHASRRPWEGEE